MRLSQIIALSVVPVALAAQLAGNENYAQQARDSLRSSLDRRATGTTFNPETVSLEVGSGSTAKQYLSATGSVFKTYDLTGSWGLDSYQGQNIPVTVFRVTGQVSCDYLGKKVAEYAASDDVWDPAFMQAVVFASDSSFTVPSDVASCLTGWGTSLVIKSGDATSNLSGLSVALVGSSSVQPGPYLAKIDSGVKLSQVYRMFRDEQQAFTTAALATTQGKFIDLASPVPGMNTISIPVPSRLYTKYLSNPRPLEGRRIAVKDIFDVAGLKTGGGSRAYWNLYPAKETSAVAIQRLIDQGGVIVGKAKTSQYANGESPTADWVDQMSPFNPRGDGYQQPSSSSTGPGAAIGAYDWIDNTIGSDTGGSITGPASVQGSYGMRPTWNAISLDGVIPLQPTQDTAGFFARDAVEGASFSRGWYGNRFGNFTSLPKTLIFPNSSWTFATGYNGTAQFNAFRQALTDYVKPTTIDGREFEGFWNSTGRFSQYNSSINTYMGAVYGNLITYYQWNNFGQQFVADFGAANDGRVPYISPSPLVRWNYGRYNVSAAAFNQSLSRKQVFKDFIDQDVLKADNVTCSNAIYVYPYTLGTPSYRNVYRNATTVPSGWGYPAQMAGVPQFVVPIGQVPYLSTITNHTEYLPLTVTMFAAAGCDYQLWDLAAALQKQGALSPVSTGSVMYPDRL